MHSRYGTVQELISLLFSSSPRLNQATGSLSPFIRFIRSCTYGSVIRLAQKSSKFPSSVSTLLAMRPSVSEKAL